MGERCGCVGQECTCQIMAGPGVILQGTGSTGNPHSVEIGPSSTQSVGVASSYINVTLTGDGTVESPYSITMVQSGLTPPSPPLIQQSFLTAGTYAFTKPVGVTLMEIILIGGGQGGGAGFAGPSPAYALWGGYGGAGGGYTSTRIATSSAVATGSIVVGAGGIGAVDTSSAHPPNPTNPSIGVVGAATVLSLPDAAGNIVVAAEGGGTDPSLGVPNAGGFGTRKGQNGGYGLVPVMRGPGGAGGGRGHTGSTWVDVNNPGSPAFSGGTRIPGGTHPHYATPEQAYDLRIGGNGGNGGLTSSLPASKSGLPGLGPGGGGGGAGYPNAGGATGGRGADGAAWIIFY